MLCHCRCSRHGRESSSSVYRPSLIRWRAPRPTHWHSVLWVVFSTPTVSAPHVLLIILITSPSQRAAALPPLTAENRLTHCTVATADESSHSPAGTLHRHYIDGHTITTYAALAERRAIKIHQFEFGRHIQQKIKQYILSPQCNQSNLWRAA